MYFIRENPSSHGQVADFKQLIRKTPLIYGQTEHLESTFFSNKVHGGEQESLTPQKTKHPCRLAEVGDSRTEALPAANCEAPSDNQTYAKFKYISRVQRLHSDVNDSSNKVASVRTCRPRH